MVFQLEASLTQFARILKQTNGKEAEQLIHGGAAGGVAAGLYALLNAQLVNGIDHFLEITLFDKALQKADLLITGEGSIDLQTLDGKAPYGAAVRAKKKNIRVIALAGKLPDLFTEELTSIFSSLININEEKVDLAIALKSTKENLIKTGIKIGIDLK